MDEAHNIALFNKLTKEEQVQFSQLLGKLSNAMQEELPEGDKNERFYEDPQKHFEMFKQFQKTHGDLPVKFFETETKNKCCQKHK
jgi:hypothetical protein